MKSGNLNFLEPSGPLQACYGTALPLPLVRYFQLVISFFGKTFKQLLHVQLRKHSIYLNIISLQTTYVSHTRDSCTLHAVHEPYSGHPCHKCTRNSHNYPMFNQHCKFRKKKRSNLFYLTKMCRFVYIVQKSL